VTGAYHVDASDTKLRASIGTGVKNPTLFELFGLGANLGNAAGPGEVGGALAGDRPHAEGIMPDLEACGLGLEQELFLAVCPHAQGHVGDFLHEVGQLHQVRGESLRVA